IDSLSVGGTDGTLTRRFRDAITRGRLHGKTGTLSTVIALSGILDVDPARPLAFSIVTNGDRPLSKGYVRKAHEQVLGLITKYLAQTTKTTMPEAKPELTPPAPTIDEPEEMEPELDTEAAGHSMPAETSPAPPPAETSP